MDSASPEEAYGGRIAAELARLREAVDDLRRRPVPPDADQLRHVVTASLSEASAPPPNLLVTAIRRLDRLDARLESIEGALGSPGALPRGGAITTVARGHAGSGPAPPSYGAPDPEAIADALARRLAALLPAPASTAPAAPAPVAGATVQDLVDALRPLVPEASRSVLRRAGREPSPQAVEVLQQTALAALEEALRAVGATVQPAALGRGPGAPSPARPQALGPAAAPAPPPPPSPPPPPVDVDALATSVAAQVAQALAEQLQPPPPPPPPPEPPRAPEPPPPLDPAVVADAVIGRLAQQPPPQAVLSAMAMAPLLSAVGNVEAAVAQLAEPEAGVMVAVSRLEAGVEALARALEEDRSVQADEVRRGFDELRGILRSELAPTALLPGDETWDEGAGDEDEEAGVRSEGGAPGRAVVDRIAAALIGMERRVDQLAERLEPVLGADVAAAVPDIAARSQRLERSVGHILTALAALAEHLQEQSTVWRSGFDAVTALTAAPGDAAGAPAPTAPALDDLGRRIDELGAGLAADRQRFQRLGGMVEGLAELLGEVSERLDRLPREQLEAGSPRWRPAPPDDGRAGAAADPSAGRPAPDAAASDVDLAPAASHDEHEDGATGEEPWTSVTADAADGSAADERWAPDGASGEPGEDLGDLARERVQADVADVADVAGRADVDGDGDDGEGDDVEGRDGEGAAGVAAEGSSDEEGGAEAAGRRASPRPDGDRDRDAPGPRAGPAQGRRRRRARRRGG